MYRFSDAGGEADMIAVDVIRTHGCRRIRTLPAEIPTAITLAATGRLSLTVERAVEPDRVPEVVALAAGLHRQTINA